MRHVFIQPVFQNSKKSGEQKAPKLGKCSRRGREIQTGKSLHDPKSFARSSLKACVNIQHGKGLAAFGNFLDQDIILERAARLPFSRVVEFRVNFDWRH